MSVIATGGVSIDLPRGWDGQIRPAGATGAPSARSAASAELGRGDDGGANVLHAASFALPAARGDYGSGAVEVMAGSDVLICLLEHELEAAATPLFSAKGVPRLSASMFSPQSMQRAIAGMSGCQHFFQVRGRPFCLYVVVGSHISRGPLVRAAAAVIRTIDIT